MSHPFAMSRFKVATPAQLQALLTSGVQQVRVDLLRSDPQAVALWRGVPHAELALECAAHEEVLEPPPQQVAGAPRMPPKLAQSSASPAALPDAPLHEPVDRFLRAADCYMELCQQVSTQPAQVGALAQDLVQGYVQELSQSSSTMVRLLAGRAGEHAAAHPVNVTVLSLLLGKSLGMNEQQLQDLGLAALLHDIGKVQLPPAFRTQQPHMEAQGLAHYQSHVGASVAVAHTIGLSPHIQQYIAQHHEFEDGSGYPLGLLEADLTRPAQVLALVNTYDHLCNPGAPMDAHTPHEAMSVLFAQRKHHFGKDLIESFIGVMGVYPPGTAVQLSDGRYGVVIGVSTKNPRKPQVRVHEGPLAILGGVPSVVDLDQHPGLLVKRSLRPEQLPRDVLESLSPQRRICYFFERAVEISAQRNMP